MLCPPPQCSDGETEAAPKWGGGAGTQELSVGGQVPFSDLLLKLGLPSSFFKHQAVDPARGMPRWGESPSLW